MSSSREDSQGESQEMSSSREESQGRVRGRVLVGRIVRGRSGDEF